MATKTEHLQELLFTQTVLQNVPDDDSFHAVVDTRNELNISTNVTAKLARHMNAELNSLHDAIYIPPNGCEYADAPIHDSFPLTHEVLHRMVETPLRSLLLLGGAGMGKTYFCLQLCKTMWETYQANQGNHLEGVAASSTSIASALPQTRIPLYVHLPEFKAYLEHGLIEQVLIRAGLTQSECLAIQTLPLQLFLDGFDEVTITHNIYQSQGWGQEGFDVKMIVTSRFNALLYEDRAALFAAPFRYQTNHYEAVHLQAFTDEQIREYLSHYVQGKEGVVKNTCIQKPIPSNLTSSSNATVPQETETLPPDDWQVTEYLENLANFSLFKVMAKTPFLLTLLARALPVIVQHQGRCSASQEPVDGFKRYNQNELFEAFLESWFLKQANQLHEQEILRTLSVEELVGYMWAYAQNLTLSLLVPGERLYDKTFIDAECLKSELMAPLYNPELLALYHHSDLTLRQSHLFFDIDAQGNTIQSQAQEQNLKAIRSSCLFQVGEAFKFLHKSVMEYFIARSIMQSLLHTPNILDALIDSDGQDQGLNRVLLTKEEGLLERFAEFVLLYIPNRALKRDYPDYEQSRGYRFQAILDQIVQASKESPEIANAAANAMTILNRVRMVNLVSGDRLENRLNFSDNDFSDIQIPGANLDGADLGRASFRGANLAGASLRQTKLISVQCQGANLADVEFGEHAIWQRLPNKVSCLATYYPDAEHLQWLVGCWDGYVYRYDDSTGKRLASYRHKAYGFKSFVSPDQYPVIALAVDSEHHIMASGGEGPIWLWSLTQGIAIQKLMGHTAYVRCLAFSSPDWLISGSADTTIRLWHLPEGTPGAVLTGHSDTVTSLAVDQDGWFVSGSKDSGIRLWHLPDGEVGPIMDRHTAWGRNLAVSPDGWLATGGGYEYEAIRLWHLPDGSPGAVIPASADFVAISADGWMATAHDKTIQIWAIPSGKHINTLSLEPGDSKRTYLGCGAYRDVYQQNRMAASIMADISSLAVHVHRLYVGCEDGFVLVINLSNPTKPSFEWPHYDGPPTLWMTDLNLSEALNLSSEANQALCSQRATLGKPNPSTDRPYQPWGGLFRSQTDTAHLELRTTLIGLEGQAPHLISETSWVVSMAKTVNQGWGFSLFSASATRAFLIIEGIRKGKHFIVRAELIYDASTSHVNIHMTPLTDLVEFQASAVTGIEAHQFEVTSREGEQLLRRIQADQERAERTTYQHAWYSSSSDELTDIETHTSLSWCLKKLAFVHQTPPQQWHPFNVKLPSDTLVSEEASTASGASSNTASELDVSSIEGLLPHL